MPYSRGALHRPFRSDVWILSQTVVCFSLWFDRFCASVPAASGRECRSKSGHACQNAFCVGGDGVWHGIAFACALTAKDRDLHSVQFVGQFQHARRVRFLGREASGYDRRSSPQKAGQNHPRKLGAAKSMIPMFSVTVDGYSDIAQRHRSATSLSDIERSATSLSDTEARGNKPFS